MTLEAYVDDFAALADDTGAEGPRWLRKAREHSLERFEKLGFPTTRDENWRFTSVSSLVDAQFRHISDPGGEVTRDQLAPFLFGHPEWPTVVFVNGRFAPALSSFATLPPGVIVADFATAIHDHEKIVERHLTTLAVDDDAAFTALNAAFMRDGALVHVAAGVEAQAPVHLVFVSDALAATGATHPRNLIVAERQSKVAVVESYVSLGDAQYFTNPVTEISIGEGATVAHYKIQRESQRAFHVGTIDARQAKDSHFVSFSFAIGGALSRTNVYTVLAGAGCGATLNGLY
ncbi:MAG: SufD family Fe-S cluster assembly protein, partial [Myxococcales bacterium]|nr:SufD family Fe-S cluster assembly protein [Myxococcales bacterium]